MVVQKRKKKKRKEDRGPRNDSRAHQFLDLQVRLRLLYYEDSDFCLILFCINSGVLLSFQAIILEYGNVSFKCEWNRTSKEGVSKSTRYRK